MAIGMEETKKLAFMARLDMSAAELERRMNSINGILKWVEQLGEVNTDNVAPLANLIDSDLMLRKDEVTDGGYAAKVLANAPEETQGYFVVPKVVE